MSSHLIVLGWHNVEGTWCFPAPPGRGLAGLQRQLTLLARLATVVPLGAALRSLAEGRPLPPRAVALTFDDGYADNLTLAVPLLQRLQLPATFFLVPGLLTDRTQPWWEIAGWAFARTSRSELDWEGVRYPLDGTKNRWAAFCLVCEKLKRRNLVRRESALAELIDMLRPLGAPQDKGLMLDWAGAGRLSQAGFEVGSHSSHHAILSEETADEQFRDLAASKTVLEAELDVPVDVLAYPNGSGRDFTATTEQAAAAANYQFALTTIPGVHKGTGDPHAVRRAVVYPEEGTLKLAKALARSLRPEPGNRIPEPAQR